MFGYVGRAIRAQVHDAGSCEGLFFSERLSAESVRSACERLQHEFRDRIFSPAITPYLVIPGVAKLLTFLKQAFATEEIHPPMMRPDGSIQHAEVRIGDSMLMMGEPMAGSPPIPAALHLYVTDADATYKSALQAGAVSLMEPVDQFYGDRMAGVKDMFGNHWYIATHRDVNPEELKRRASSSKQKVQKN